MSPGTHMLFSFALTYGVPMALAWRELHQLGQLQRRKPDDDGDCKTPAPVVWPTDGSRPLPDCLIPRPQRELV